jgi:Uma2 family endonuclease
MAVTQQRLSLEEFLKLPEEKPALEFLHGAVTQKVSPKFRHVALQGELLQRINGFGRPRRLAYAAVELRATFAGASVVPDVAVYLWDRIPRDAAGELVDDVFDPPDIAVEVISPGQTIRELVQRCQWYVANGVPVSLLVHPERQTVMIFRAGAEARTLRGPDRIDLDDLLPGFELTVDELFEAARLR